jgi:aspartate racemase
MVALSVAHAAALAGPGGSVGILASPALRRIGLLDRPLAAAGLVPAYPRDEEAMLATIRRIKAEGAGREARLSLDIASADLLARGARVQMVACTEFSRAGTPTVPGVVGFDALDLLVDAIIAFATADDVNGEKTAAGPSTNSANAQDSQPNKETIP